MSQDIKMDNDREHKVFKVNTEKSTFCIFLENKESPKQHTKSYIDTSWFFQFSI